MKICQSHWDLLRAEITKLGLSHLVARSADEANGVVERALDGSYDSYDDFDPLLLANYYIWHAAIELYGPELMITPTDVGDPRCPLCEHQHHDRDPLEWVDMAMDIVLMEARRLGFVPSLQ